MKCWNGNYAFDRDEPDKMAALFGLSSRKGLYPGMKWVSAARTRSGFRFTPTWRERGGVFRGYAAAVREAQEVRLPPAASDAELGAAVREALARCSG